MQKFFWKAIDWLAETIVRALFENKRKSVANGIAGYQLRAKVGILGDPRERHTKYLEPVDPPDNLDLRQHVHQVFYWREPELGGMYEWLFWIKPLAPDEYPNRLGISTSWASLHTGWHEDWRYLIVYMSSI